MAIHSSIFLYEDPPLYEAWNSSNWCVYPATKKDEELTVEFVKHFPGFQGNFKNFIRGIANNMDIKA